MWRTITLDDIAATLSQAELDAYRRSASDGAGAPDPVGDLLARTAEMIRGYIRANTSVRLNPAPWTLPDSLISPACDYAAYDVLKRMPVKITEPRQKARDAARVRLRSALASLGYTPEGGFPGDDEVPPAEAGSLQDLSSDARLRLQLETAQRQAASLRFLRCGVPSTAYTENASCYNFTQFKDKKYRLRHRVVPA